MRDTDELMRDIMDRKKTVSKRRSAKKLQVVYAVCACACLALLILTAAFLPQINETASTSMEQHYGSLILRTPYMGYVVIGFLAFACGVFVSLLACHCRMANQDRKEH